MKTIINIICLTLLSGCAATYHPVSKEKLLINLPAPSTNATRAMVTVKRDKSFFGSALDARFYLNGKHIVTLSQAETYVFAIISGNHKFGVKSIQPIMMIPIPFYREIDVNLEANKAYEYIFKSIPSGGLKIEPVETSDI